MDVVYPFGRHYSLTTLGDPITQLLSTHTFVGEDTGIYPVAPVGSKTATNATTLTGSGTTFVATPDGIKPMTGGQGNDGSLITDLDDGSKLATQCSEYTFFAAEF